MSNPSQQRVAVVTGASSGIGKAAAKALAAMGWRVIGVGRDPARSAAAQAEIEAAATGGGGVAMIRADLSSLPDAARCAGEIVALTDRLDVLINNAGGIVGERTLTAEGHEATFAGNHLGPFLLTAKLMPLLEATAAGQEPGQVRVVTVSSSGHAHFPAIAFDDLTGARRFNSGAAYCQAKLANVLFTRELAHRAAPSGIVAHAMHPGVVASRFGSQSSDMKSYLQAQSHRAATPEQAGDDLVWLATAEEPGGSTGGYWHQRQQETPSDAARDDEQARRLWEVSTAMVEGY